MSQSQKGQDQGVITQGTMYLKPFECEVSLLHTPDGDFVPLVELCSMLGVPVAPYTAMACKRFRPEGAIQRLPFQVRPESPPRQVWCLRNEEVLFWLSSIPSDRVSPARREQQRTFRLQMMRIAGDVYDTLQRQYRVTRSDLFGNIHIYETLPAQLRHLAAHTAPHLAPDDLAELDLLMARGYTLLEECTLLARSVAQEIAQQPIVDTLVVNAEGEIVDTQSMPILPILPSEPSLRQAEARLAMWLHEFEAFVTGHLPV